MSLEVSEQVIPPVVDESLKALDKDLANLLIVTILRRLQQFFAKPTSAESLAVMLGIKGLLEWVPDEQSVEVATASEQHSKVGDIFNAVEQLPPDIGFLDTRLVVLKLMIRNSLYT